MLASLFATKIGMTQAWTTAGKRVPVTRCKAQLHVVATVTEERVRDRSQAIARYNKQNLITLGIGERKTSALAKPQRVLLEKAGVKHGVTHMRTVRPAIDQDMSAVTPGTVVDTMALLEVGDVVKVQGVTKGRGYAGVVKRHGFAGGPKTHGQSDRHRAPGAIGNRTTPGRVFKNKRMAGHMGVENLTVSGLTVLHIDRAAKEIWLSGPVPGAISTLIRITKTPEKKDVALDSAASGIKVEAPVEEVVTPEVETAEVPAEATEAPVETQEETKE